METTRKLKLAHPITFGSRSSWYTRASVFAIALFAPLAPLLFLRIDGATLGYSVVGGMFAIAAVLLFQSRAGRTITVTWDGIESKSMVGRQLIPWDELLEIKSYVTGQTDNYSGVRTYELRGKKTHMYFADSLQDASYLIALCEAALNSSADHDGFVFVDHLTPANVQDAGPLFTPLFIGALCIIAATVTSFVNAGAFTQRFVLPSATVDQAKHFTDRDVRLSGKLHSDDQLSSRDGKYKFGLQVAELNAGDDDRSQWLPMWTPERAWLTDGKEKVDLEISEPTTENLQLAETGYLHSDWKQSKLANLICDQFDQPIDDELQKVNHDRDPKDQLAPRVHLYTVLQDAPVTVTGHLVKSGDHLMLSSAGGKLWISAGAMTQFGDDAYPARWIGTAVVFLLWGILGVIVGQKYFESQKRNAKETQAG